MLTHDNGQRHADWRNLILLTQAAGAALQPCWLSNRALAPVGSLEVTDKALVIYIPTQGLACEQENAAVAQLEAHARSARPRRQTGKFDLQHAQ